MTANTEPRLPPWKELGIDSLTWIQDYCSDPPTGHLQQDSDTDSEPNTQPE
jgi:hypothetical protein